jgi:O-methyltransferase
MATRKLSDVLANSWIGMKTKATVSRIELAILSYYKKYGRGRLGVGGIRRFWRIEPHVLFSPAELWMLRSLAQAQKRHGGAFAEVGVARGVSAEVLCEGKDPSTRLYLFDTFEGLPAPGPLDPRFEKGMFHTPEGIVRQRLSRYKNWHVFKGLFPATGEAIAHETFSLVHLDVDLYESTLQSLQFFWGRMLKGGIVISHDYSQCEGVYRAFRDFFDGRTDARLVELPTSQIMVIKD